MLSMAEIDKVRQLGGKLRCGAVLHGHMTGLATPNLWQAGPDFFICAGMTGGAALFEHLLAIGRLCRHHCSGARPEHEGHRD